MPSQKLLRIAIVCDSVTDCLAGSFVSTQRFSRLLRDRGHHIIFIAARSPASPRDDDFDGMKAYRFRSLYIPNSEGEVYLGFPTPRELRNIFEEEKIDIVHSMIPTPAAMTAVRAARQKKIPMVVHSHTQPDNIFLHLPVWLPVASLSALFYSYLHWIYGKAHAIIHPSLFSRSRFSKVSSPHNEIISNGVDPSVFHKCDTSAFRTRFNIPEDKTYIVFVGRLQPEKNVEVLVRAIPLLLKKHPHIHTVLVGTGKSQTSLIKLAKELGVENNITFCGKVSDEDVVAAYSLADLFVMPSLAELEGMAVLEAMSVGAPLLVADSRESAATLFVQGNGLLFNPHDPQELAEKALQILNDDALRRKMADASLKKSRDFHIHESAERIERLYYKVLASWQ